jgi:hypothetical protein
MCYEGIGISEKLEFHIIETPISGNLNSVGSLNYKYLEKCESFSLSIRLSYDCRGALKNLEAHVDT